MSGDVGKPFQLSVFHGGQERFLGADEALHLVPDKVVGFVLTVRDFE